MGTSVSLRCIATGMGSSGLEPPTSRLSGVCSNQLSYNPSKVKQNKYTKTYYIKTYRKEVIQPHLPIRLPCYDFTPVISPALGGSTPTLGITNSHGVTGGVYKTRERIHRNILICDY